MNETVYETIKEAVAEYNYPVLFNAPVGHVEHNLPLWLNTPSVLSVTSDGALIKSMPLSTAASSDRQS